MNSLSNKFTNSQVSITIKVYILAMYTFTVVDLINLNEAELINFYSPWNHQKTVDFRGDKS